MSEYLARLKQLESDKNFQNTHGIEPAKPSKGGFGGFGGFGGKHLGNILITNTTAPPEHEIKLKRLVRLVSDHHNFTKENYEEALETALADFDSAMICFTSLARKAGLL